MGEAAHAGLEVRIPFESVFEPGQGAGEGGVVAVEAQRNAAKRARQASEHRPRSHKSPVTLLP